MIQALSVDELSLSASCVNHWEEEFRSRLKGSDSR